MKAYKDILEKLPYTAPFLFVDELFHIDEEEARGSYTFRPDAYFYKGHFKDFPVTPGVILTECCAQIGLVCLGVHLLSRGGGNISEEGTAIALSSSHMEFYLPVFPGERVTVYSEKEYFRFNKLKCTVKMYNTDNKLVCKGTLSGMLQRKTHG
ncbi:MAG: FabA/FabZ family ACP-dehydratase [Bacteroidota bacterium]